MDGLDNHYSALWVQNEKRQGKPTAKFTVDRLEVQGMTITETVVTDVEQWT